jgi:hypothetical protein
MSSHQIRPDDGHQQILDKHIVHVNRNAIVHVIRIAIVHVDWVAIVQAAPHLAMYTVHMIHGCCGDSSRR